MITDTIRIVAHGMKTLEESVFGPCTPHGTPGQVERTWGTRPEARTLVARSHPPERADLFLVRRFDCSFLICRPWTWSSTASSDSTSPRSRRVLRLRWRG